MRVLCKSNTLVMVPLLTVFTFYHPLIIRLGQSTNAMQLNGELLHSASLYLLLGNWEGAEFPLVKAMDQMLSQLGLFQ